MLVTYQIDIGRSELFVSLLMYLILFPGLMLGRFLCSACLSFLSV